MTVARKSGALPREVAQAWIETIAQDPEAVSALVIARRTLAGVGDLRSLRRVRLIEIEGRLPDAITLAARLHDSTRFYNPHKERCTVRRLRTDATPLEPTERAALVFDREGERRPASERWWKRVTGDTVRVREGTVWIAGAASADETGAALNMLMPGPGFGHGLLCNANAQEFRRADSTVPLPWFSARAGRRRGKA